MLSLPSTIMKTVLSGFIALIQNIRSVYRWEENFQFKFMARKHCATYRSFCENAVFEISCPNGQAFNAYSFGMIRSGDSPSPKSI